MVGDLTAPVSSDLMRIFQIYFACHIFLSALSYVVFDSQQPLLLGLPIMLIAVITTFYRRFSRFGLLILLVFQLWNVVIRFPMTANHHYLEALILLFLVLFPNRIVDPENRLVDSTSCRLIQLTVLYAYFYSAIHKLVQGFWLDGEFLAWSLFSPSPTPRPIYFTTRMLLQAIANLLGLPLGDIPFERSLDMGQVSILIPAWIMITLLVISWITIASEMIIPWLVVNQKTRHMGRYLLLMMTILIGLPSLEMQFFFAAVACDLLFFPKRPLYNYTILLIIHFIFSALVVGYGIFISGDAPVI